MTINSVFGMGNRRRVLLYFIFSILIFSNIIIADNTTGGSEEVVLSTFEFTYSSSDPTSISMDAITIDGSIGAGEYAYTVVLDATFTLHYTLDGNYIYMGVDATTTGWASIGWGTGTNGMDGFDYIVGFYDTAFNIQDSFGSASNKLIADTTGDIISSAGSESGGQTVFEFSRLLNTGDSTHDTPIVDGEPITVHWGSDASDDFVSRHDVRGFTTLAFNSVIIDGTIDAGEYVYSEVLDAVFTLYYTIVGNYIFMAVDATTGGWASIGWGTVTDRMLGLDYVIGFYSAGFQIQDSYGSASTNIASDTTQNIISSAGSESGAQTVFEFSRLLNTGDATHDTTIVADASTSVQWAINNKDDFTSKHGSRGTATITFSSTISSTVPDAATDLAATSSSGQVDLAWTVPGDGGDAITSQTVYRSTTSGSGYSQIASVGAAATSYSDTSVVDGNTYYYVVTATNGIGEGANSNEDTGNTKPAAPSVLSATPATGQVDLSWNAPLDGGSTITSYNILRSTTSGSGHSSIDTSGTNSYSDTTAVPGTTYYYLVNAVNTIGTGGNSNEASGAAPTAPTVPQSPGVSIGDTQLTITWSAPSSDGNSAITGYTVYRHTSTGGPYTSVATLGVVLTWTDTGRSNGVEYFYVITATNDVGESGYSSETSGIPATNPGVPTSLAATYGAAHVNLTWVAPSGDGGSAITDYNIYRSTTSGSGFAYVGSSGGSLLYSDTGLTNGVTYYFIVRAVNAISESTDSNEANAKPLDAPSAPQSPSASKGNGSVLISWTTSATDGGTAITGYNVYRSTSSGSYGAALATLGVVLSFNDTTAVNGQLYYYIIIAINAEGQSLASNEVNATPATKASAPQNVGSSHADGSITITWQTPPSDGGSTVTGYKVYRSATSGSGYTLQASPGGLTWTDTPLTNGDVWYYIVVAVNGEGDSVYSAEVSDAAATLPGAPTTVTISHGGGTITVDWGVPADDGGSTITGYNVYRSTTSGSYGAALATLGVVLTYTDNTVSNGQVYYYVITAVTSEGESVNSGEVSDTPATVPGIPTGLTATYGNAEVALSWTAPASNGGSTITGYKVFSATSSGGPYSLVIDQTGTSYTDTGLTNGVEYFYVVLAYNAEGASAYSIETSATPLNVPSAPQTLAGTPGNTQVVLTWSTPSDDGGTAITGYNVYRSTTQGVYGAPIANLTVVLTYTDTGLTNGITYYYTIKAVNAEGESISSNEISIIPVTVPTVPQTVGITHGDGSMTLTWTAPADNGGSAVTGYKVFRSGSSGGPYTLQASPAGLTWTDNVVTNGVEYFYVIVAVNAVGDSSYSSEVSDIPAALASAPQTVTISHGNGFITINWNTPADDGGSPITGYNVYRSTTQSVYGPALANLGVVLTYNDTTAVNGQLYYFKVVAVTAEGEGADSLEVSDTAATVPGAPTGLTPTYGNAQISLSWTVPGSDGGSTITGYKLYSATSSGGAYSLVIDQAGTSYTHTGLTNGVEIFYVVLAYNAEGSSVYSTEASATPLTVPTVPQSVSASKGNTYIVLNWLAPNDNGGTAITGYNIFRSTTSGSGYSSIATLGVVLTFNDTLLSNGVEYFYLISAINAEGSGTNSSEISAIPATIPTVPQSLNTSHGNGFITISWSVPSSDGGSSITGYKVYRSSSSGGPWGVPIATPVATLYNDTGLTNGDVWYYTVVAVNAEGDSGFAIEVSDAAATVASAPQTLSSSFGDSTVTLTWSIPASDGGSSIAGYKVYRSTSSGSYGAALTTLGVVLTYDDNSVTNGVQYYYTITAINAEGDSSSSNEINVIPGAAPSAPTGVVATKGNSHVNITWNTATDNGYTISNYKIYRSLTSGSGYSILASPTGLNYTDNTVVNGITYYYIVSAVNAIAEGSASSEVNATPATVPTAPLNPAASYDNTFIILTWSNSSSTGGSDITGYKVYRSTTSGSYGAAIATLGIVLTYNDTGLSNGVTYYYVITAINAEGESVVSGEVSAVPSTTPSAPTALTPVAGDNNVTLSWTAGSNGGASISIYHVYRSTTSGSGYVEIGTSGSAAYTDNTASNGVTYYYVVTSENINGLSPYSTQGSATPSGPPSFPQTLSATAGDGFVDLTWVTPSNDGGSSITGYKVYRSATSGSYGAALATLGVVLSYNDTSAVNGQTYYYIVTAINANGESGSSNEVLVTLANVPSEPQTVAATHGNAQVVLTWETPATDKGFAISGYNVYRSNTSGSDFVQVATLGVVLTFTDTSLVNGQTYYYKLTAVNANGEGAFSSEADATPATVPDAPSGSASSGNTEITLSWSTPADGGSTITGYKIYRSITSGSYGAALTTLPVQTSYTDSSLTNGVTYYYVITALNIEGESVISSEVSSVPSTVPDAPTGLNLTPSVGQIDLSWTAPSSDGGAAISQYNVYRSAVSGSGYAFVSSTASTSYSDTTVVNGNTYYYVITAENIKGEGVYSTEAGATAGTVPSAPLSPSGTPSYGQVDLSWSAPSSTGGLSILEYRVMRSTTSGSGYTQIGTTGPSTLSYSDTNVTNGVSYYYVLTAVNAIGESAISSEVSAAPGSVTSVPQTPAINSTDSSITITWTAPADIGGFAVTGYNVYRSTTSGSYGAALANLGGVLTYTDNTVSNGQIYYFIITAVNSKGESSVSNEVSAIPSTVPSAPTGAIGADGDGSVSLSWNVSASDGGASITLYRILRSATSGSGYVEIGTSVSTSYTDNTVSNGDTVYYVIVAVNLRGDSVTSNEVIGTPGTITTAPTSLGAVKGNSHINLTWSAPISNGGWVVTGYNIYSSTTSGTYGAANVSLGVVLSYTYTGLINGQTYYFVVTAINIKGESAVSSEAFATPSTIPSAVNDLAAIKGDTTVSLTWSAPSDGGSSITGYKLYRSLSSGNGFTLLDGGIAAGTTNYDDTGLTKGTTYYYHLIATNNNGDSGISNEVNATPTSVPGAPTGLTGTTGLAQIDLSWSTPSDTGGLAITSYSLFRSTSQGSGYILVISQASTSYSDTGLTNGVTYYYVVNATNSEGTGVNSLEFSGTPGAAPTAPLSVVAVEGNSHVNLTWSVPASDNGFAVTGYNVYRSTTSGSGYVLISSPASLVYSDTGLNNSQTYYYVITALNSQGESIYSLEASATPATVPTSPTSLGAVKGNTYVVLSWSSSAFDGGSAIIGYNVYRSTTSGSYGAAIANLGVVLTFNDTTVSNGQIYYYVVTAVNAKGISGQSNEAFATPSTIPSAVNDLAAVKGDTTVSLSWSAPSDGGSVITGYKLYRSLSSGSGFTLLDDTIAAGATNYLDTGLTKGTTYYYHLIATNNNGDSNISNEVNGTPTSVPDAPTGLSATKGNGQIDLTWIAPIDDGGLAITFYSLYRSTTSGFGYVLVVSQAGTSYSDIGLVNGQTYYYVVNATNSEGSGVFSLQASATPGAAPTEPLSVAATDGNAQVDFSWSVPSSDNGFTINAYNVYRSTVSGSGYVLIGSPTGTSYSDVTVVNGQTYYYVITAVNSQGESIYSLEVSALPGTSPTAPTALSATTGYDYVYLTWGAPASDGGLSVTSYEIYRSTTSGSGFSLYDTVAGNVYDYIDTTVVLGTQYFYHIVAINLKGSSTTSLEVNGQPGGAPDTINDLIINARNSQIVINWTSPFDGGFAITGYEVWRLNETSGLLELLGTVSTLYYVDNGLPNGQTFTYHIIAVNLLGNSLESNYVTGTPSTIPDEPTNLIISYDDSELTISWDVPNDGGSVIIEYNIYRTDSIDGNYTLIDSATSNLYVDINVTNGQEYFYKITTITANGESKHSLFVYATPMGISDRPANFSVSFDGVNINLSWDAPFDQGSVITNYLIYRAVVTNSTYLLVGNVTALLFQDVDITLGTEHFYQVSAVNAIGESKLADELSLTPATEPDAPVLSNIVEGESIILDWNIPVENGESLITYTVYRLIVEDGGQFTPLLNITANVYNDSDLIAEVTYQYAVSATNVIGESSLSNSITVASPVVIEEPPTDPTTTEPSTSNTLPTTSEPPTTPTETDTTGPSGPNLTLTTGELIGMISLSVMILAGTIFALRRLNRS